MVRSWRLAFGLASALVGAVAIACGPGFLDGISGGAAAGNEPDGAAPISDGGTDAPVCISELAPPAPTTGDDTAANLALTFAFDTMRIDSLGTAGDAGAIPRGLDLDQTCTCPANDSCVRPAGLPTACDGTKGQDNALASLFNQLNAALPIFPPTFVQKRIRAGNFTVLVDVRGWNGLPDDPSVFVTIRLSQQIDKTATDGGRREPLFDGNDLWTIAPESVTGGDSALGKDCRDQVNSLFCIARILDSKAYVTGGKLVARPRVDVTGTLPVPLYIRSEAGQIAFDLFDFTLVADIGGPSGGPYRLDGEIAGRFETGAYLTSLANLQDVTEPGTNEPPLCEKPAFLALLQSAVCAARDLAPPGKDNTGAACSFLSAAFSFGASPARGGVVLRKDSPERACGDASFGCP